MPRGTQVKRDGLTITLERGGHKAGLCPADDRVVVKHLSPLQLHVWSAQDHTGDCPQKHKPQGSDSQDNQE